ncbi:hypothetical protein CDAR_398221 [Caerostris darwini]|uniref:Uncharacterized protein n=1 Tax=Caerostris darwini TaxID=1538125 RepID=A0AAV4WRF0_9ARAC|nr:hypothetical protein CDAR_398221 [Caerostris darwini]
MGVCGIVTLSLKLFTHGKIVPDGIGLVKNPQNRSQKRQRSLPRLKVTLKPARRCHCVMSPLHHSSVCLFSFFVHYSPRVGMDGCVCLCTLL